MKTEQTGPAKLYTTKRKDTPYVVVFRDPTQREPSGRAKRVPKWFSNHGDALVYRNQVNERLLVEGAAGMSFDANVRADAVAARRHLDSRGFSDVSLLHLATQHTSKVISATNTNLPIAPEVEQFLDEQEHVEGAAPETIKNLYTRIWLWIDLAKIRCVGDINRHSVEVLRKRTKSGHTGKLVSARTRKNDMAAVSNFCTWLLSCTPPKIDSHPLKGLKRPRVPNTKKPTFSPDECNRGLAAAQSLSNAHLATLAVMIFSGARPSELEETRIYYGRSPVVRIEGGKLKGRANRNVPMLPVLRAFLKVCGDPSQVQPFTRYQREQVAKLAGIKWKSDICRHTFISYQLQLLQNDALVARQGGTSEAIIYRHYHRLHSIAEARAWEKTRPGATLTKALESLKLAA